MGNPWGRFTIDGCDELEDQITALVADSVEICKSVLDPADYRAVVLIGGYGRGEGGVQVKDGKERPHNNLDYLVIANAPSRVRQAELESRLREALVPVTRKYDIEIDLSTTSVRRLMHSQNLMIWCDMRFGHKTILGDSSFVPSLTRFRLDRIPAWDARNLLVNRGSLLVTNSKLLESGALDDASRRLIIKHAMKAIIGYGDALLFFLGDYDWSYAEKQRRMRARKDLPASVRDIYEEAISFRFRPRYAEYMDRDMAAWMSHLYETLAPLHLMCESKRLGVENLAWEDYPDTALRHAILDDAISPRGWAKKAYYSLKSRPCPAPLSMGARFGYRLLGERGLLPIVFPVVAYDLHDEAFRELAAGFLGAANNDIEELRRAYLLLWGKVGDVNFSSILRQWNMSLDKEDSENRE